MSGKVVAGAALFVVLLVTVAVTLSGSGFFVKQTVTGGQQVQQQVILSDIETTTEGGTISAVTLTVGGNGPRDLDLRNVTIDWNGTNQSHRLRLAGDATSPESIRGKQFAYRVVEDENQSAPILDGAVDRVQLIVRPESFLSTPPSTSTTVRIAVNAPDRRSATFNLSSFVETESETDT